MRAREHRNSIDNRGGTISFVANLRPRTITAFAQEQMQPDAYLLSSHRLTRRTLRHAHAIRDQGLALFADNGSKQLIDDVIAAFSDAARPIATEVRTIRRRIGETPRGQSVPARLRRDASDLAHAVVEECTKLSDAIDPSALLDQQLSMHPTHLIAQEDFAVACLIALGLERETIGWDIAAFDRRNRRSLRLFERVASDGRTRTIDVYAVLSAMDYNTARSAGVLAARSGATHVALGMAGIMRDPSAVDFFVLRHGSFKLEATAPRRYVRLAQIARGIADGYREAGMRLRAFHALGLGAIPLLPVLAAPFDSATRLTIDATSPIHDAVRDHVLYHPVRNGDRSSRVAIVRRIVRGDDWPFACPFCLRFRENVGHSATAATAWWTRQGEPRIEGSDLRVAGPLVEAVPLFASVPEQIARRAGRVHVAHNHFVLDQLASEILAGAARPDRAMTKLEELLDHQSLITGRGLRAAREILTQLLA
jgi:hypothetical protein